MVVAAASAAWDRLGLGLRTSSGFRIGAGLLTLCVLVQLVMHYAPLEHWDMPAVARFVPWWLFSLTLTVLGASYFSLTVRTFFGFAGALPGLAHLLQAIFLLLALRGVNEIYFLAPYIPLLKYGALVGFVLLDRYYMTAGTRRLLLLVAVVEPVKVLVRTYELLPVSLGRPIDAVLALVQAFALWRLAADVYDEENLWANSLLGSSGETLEDRAESRGGKA